MKLALGDVYQTLLRLSLLVAILCFAIASARGYAEYKTCCDVKTKCEGCKNIFSYNSIPYCCPGCRGEIMVTNGICECTVVVDNPNETPNCTVSNKVLGDYHVGLTSWYSAGSVLSSSLLATLLLAISAAQLFIRRVTY